MARCGLYDRNYRYNSWIWRGSTFESRVKIIYNYSHTTSVIIVGYALKIITEYIISKNDINELKQKKMQKKIDALSDHVIICGYGRNGKQTANKLATHHRDFVVIEKDEQVTQKHKDTSTLFIHGMPMKMRCWYARESIEPVA